MSCLDITRAELALIILYLNKYEARDKICRSIQYGCKFLSGGHPGTAYTVDKNTSLGRKAFRLFKFVNDLHGFISPVPSGTPLPLLLLRKAKNALMSTFYFLDQFVWLGRSGIYKNKERTEFIGRIALFCGLGANACRTVAELVELGWLSSSMKNMGKERKDNENDELYRAKLQKPNKRIITLIKSSMEIVVFIGLLKLVPKIVTPRITGAFGLTTSLISCYQLLPNRPKFKTPRSRKKLIL